MSLKVIKAAVSGQLIITSAMFGLSAHAAEPTTANTASQGNAQQEEATLPEVSVKSKSEAVEESYAGGQVAKRANLGLLGVKSVMDTPFNQTSYTAQTIEDFQARSLSDLLIADPSVRLSSARNNINEDFAIRGFSVASQDVALNGMYGLSPYYRVPLEFVERVEVLKGPSALLNGIPPSGNIGGSINVVAKRAGNDQLTRVTASYLSDSIFGTHVDIGRRFGQNQEFGVRVNGMYRHGNTSQDLQKAEDHLGSLGLDYRGERLRVSADLIYQRQDTDRVSRQFSLGPAVTKLPGAPDNKLNYPGTGYSDMKDRSQVIHAEYDISDHLTVYAGYGTRTSRMNAVAGNPEIKDNAGNFSSSAVFWQLFNIDSRSLEAGLRTRFETGPVKHAASFNGSKVNQTTSIFMTPVMGTLLSNLYDPIYTSTASTSGIETNITKYEGVELSSYALADTLSFNEDKVQITLGARHQTVKSPEYVFGTGAKTGEYDKSAVTPVLGVVVKPWEHVSLYANYIEGLSPAKAAPAFLNVANAGQAFSPFKTQQREAGVKVDFGRFTTTVSLFEIERPTASINNNVYGYNGEQRNRGLELNLFGEVVDHVRLLGGAAYTQSKLSKTSGGTFDGNRGVGISRIQANLGAEWDTLFVPGLTLNARAIYTGKQYNDQANNIDIPSWTRFDIGARYKTVIQDKPVVFRANIENVFDRDYWSTSNNPTEPGYLYIGAPRTLLVSATIDF
ncbi:TonB-dependent siderophore receptor [Methylobacillus gramineus]|uniref:TonB-dependent receptor n=1 Tax=Methylobacillus gramineus TaxID=755169 RepID=UPI001CFFE75A|nr:TonB-dependent siderophore receptor [Methylobacillus gramineus]MCB5185461.1 TonB-dependent siderophore receptor [Methylobacillus gramineus]